MYPKKRGPDEAKAKPKFDEESMECNEEQECDAQRISRASP